MMSCMLMFVAVSAGNFRLPEFATVKHVRDFAPPYSSCFRRLSVLKISLSLVLGCLGLNRDDW